MNKLYTAKATATGGRNGNVKSSDGILDLELRTPKAMGGANDDYTNPEQLFAAGYAACFDSALNLIAKANNAAAGTATVTAEVSIGKNDKGGYGLGVVLNINIAGVELSVAQDLAAKAHEICPYSNAIRGNVAVELVVTNEV
ncbi:organic hydroperoxide resistance protein [Flavobacterium rivuli WB 3.3-2 = DSM 21788]|uniref:Organic hydroperoxide resistance protein n=1 Tax=Flavobacterium rivuli WB 3.3-2 = DSM 21788 TaxID=1121895 RepID=A0A0A2MCP0_9FLAO|nr:organic hydroperoxide resistance protein [Flavobacterium rivuli]KGO86050.1 organic hydroperoxide resistance protein [Flavobacterium rivuli WB 3.3-2 = DSM 21788]